MIPFMFATGIENSYPTILLPNGKEFRVDEMEKANHYNLWKQDFGLVKEMGITHLRYGPPYHLTHLAPGKYHWDFMDETLAELDRLHIVPIIDLCHFGVPDWLENFQNPDFPNHFREYAKAFATRYPKYHLYTPVNEINICAVFSAQFGWWNERKSDEKSYISAVKNMCKANLLGMAEILKIQPNAIFIQSEGWEYFHTENKKCKVKADFLNEKRFLSYDLTIGYPSSLLIQNYIFENGFTKSEYDWFRNNPCKGKWVIGADYYAHNEHMVHEDGHTSDYFNGLGFYQVAKQYYNRYKVPVMYTETNISNEFAPDWLRKQWKEFCQLKADGVPVVGFTWYSLLDQVDWDTALRENNGNVNSFGLYDLDRQIRPVGEVYKKIIAENKKAFNP